MHIHIAMESISWRIVRPLNTANRYIDDVMIPLDANTWAEVVIPEPGEVELVVDTHRYGKHRRTIKLQGPATARDVMQAIYDFYTKPFTDVALQEIRWRLARESDPFEYGQTVIDLFERGQPVCWVL